MKNDEVTVVFVKSGKKFYKVYENIVKFSIDFTDFASYGKDLEVKTKNGDRAVIAGYDYLIVKQKQSFLKKYLKKLLE